MKKASARGLGAPGVAGLLLAVAAYPLVARQLVEQRHADAAARIDLALRDGQVRPADDTAQNRAENTALSLRVRRLSGLLASWETIGGCGAGSSTGAGGSVRWIGRSTHGGLYNQQVMASYLRLDDGYNLGLNAQFTRDLTEKWNVGLSVPLLYKYYRDYYELPLDISNSGFGDVSALVTRRFGEINDTALILAIGIPTGVHDGKYRNDYLTQEKQLGAGKLTGSLALEHTLDQDWGVAVFGASASHRGGENDLGNYRAPTASAYGFCGYFLGPWVPSVGLTVQRFLGVDRDRGLDQQVQLMSATATVAMEWSTDWIAVLAGASLPYGWEGSAAPDGAEENDLLGAGLQPWTLSVGMSMSPF